ncbi:hypothetical protein H650_10660 [Enterobacter sp. R4-368]|nr:hypothetical protein H650_10660 [Enterobacter sp. R4-368]
MIYQTDDALTHGCIDSASTILKIFISKTLSAD